MKLRGRVEHLKLEGGVWVFVGEDGQQYELVDSPKELRHSGLKCEVTGSVEQGFSLAMVGPQLKVASFKKL